MRDVIGMPLHELALRMLIGITCTVLLIAALVALGSLIAGRKGTACKR